MNGRLTCLTRSVTQSGAQKGIQNDSLRLEYDRAGNLTGEHGTNGTLHYRHDALNNLSALTLPDGQQIQWLRYGSGQVSALKFAGSLVSEFSRDTLHRETCRSQGVRIQHSAYTRHGCLSEQCSRLAASAQAEHSPQPPQAKRYRRSYGYTARDEIAAIYDSIRGTSRYLYDAESRYQEVLLADDGGDGTHLLFDNADNILRAERLPQSGMAGQKIPGNRLEQLSRGAEKRHWQHDSQGRRCSQRHGSTHSHGSAHSTRLRHDYQYDADGQLIAVRGTDGKNREFTAHYHYDVVGRRTGKQVTYLQRDTDHHGTLPPDISASFLWHGSTLLQETRLETRHKPHLADVPVTRTCFYDPDNPWHPLACHDHSISPYTGSPINRMYWHTTSVNGMPQALWNEDGDLCWYAEEDLFGSEHHIAGLNTDSFGYSSQDRNKVRQPLRYAGQYLDEETELHYNLFRHYDPWCGRFIQPDPIGLAGGLNLYTYAPNPLNWIDPPGLKIFV